MASAPQWFVGHPSDEQIGAYVDGGLRHAERDHVEAHVVNCERCRVIVGDVLLLQLADRTMRTSRRHVVWSATSLLVAVVVVLSLFGLLRRSELLLVVLPLGIVALAIIGLVGLVGAALLARQHWRAYRVGKELRQIEADAYRERYGTRP